MRLTKIEGSDLRLFDFDHDLTWYVFFMNAEEHVYGRYGGRDAASAEARISLAGLRYAMQAALDAHKKPAHAATSPPPPMQGKEAPIHAEDFPTAKKRRPGECIHCHQVNEHRRAYRKSIGEWSRDELWVYPLPENVGVTLDVDRGNLVRAVANDSSAARAGIQAGDVIKSINGMSVASFADMQYALHRSQAEGNIEASWEREGKLHQAEMQLLKGWRKTNLTWRPSLLDILPSLPLYGDDLTAAEKKTLGLAEKHLAFRQDKKVHSTMSAAGVQADDVVVGVNSLALDMNVDEFLAYMRRNYLVGDRVTLNVIRNGKRLDLPLTLR